MSGRVSRQHLALDLVDHDDATGDGLSHRFAEDLYRAEADGLERYAARRDRSRQDARDLVHDFFCRLLRLGGHGGTRPPEPRAYARLAVRNLVFNRARDERVRTSHTPLLNIEAVDPADPHSQLENRETLRLIEEAIACLPPRTREIFLARRLDGMSYAEIAERTGLKVRGVEKHMRNAIAHIGRMVDRP